ncbi:GSU2403 family nucleotidyltransferase fold protein [Rhodoferax ferrireducens]|uniref:GSU2403 family nucleotidyltransferase fold protein n=1 Tax=Rhodoferax ferrireducens TaxID=192843 RepID=UPI000E0DEF7F|nr:GSU2403 family nucleotidyltransferase fold protein [Rhodoferax ferrireducens]
MQNDYENLAFIELTEAQTRQYIDAEASWRALEDAQTAAAEVRGSMMWRTQTGRRYLIRVAAFGAQTSLGPHSLENEQIYERFMARKVAVQARQKQLRQTVAQHIRVNRALRVGRVPNVVVDTLNALANAGLQQHFLTVGTHALYAYETACGVRVQTEATATQDIDLLLDTRKYLSFATTLQRLDTSLLGIFQKVDKTFVLRDDQKYTAVNAAGFEIDVIRRTAQSAAGTDPHPLRVSQFEEDFWAVQVPSGQAMLDGGRFKQVVVATNGDMATMHAPSPESFVRIKTALSQRHDRDPLKSRKDLLQAQVVKKLLDEYGLSHVANAQSQSKSA